MKLTSLENLNGITVAELKRHIADWPEINNFGDPTEVWVVTGHYLSSQCTQIEVLTLRNNPDGTESSDLLFGPNYDHEWRGPSGTIPVPIELLNVALEDLHELKSEWAWRVATTEKNNRLVAELDQRICQIKALLAEGREG